jgi:NADP-dependent 3-hydroxy acid dehydrogenase YdfG
VLGDTRPTALQIIQDDNLKGKLTSKVTDITGTTSRIGIETTRALSITGATLILTARDLKIILADILEPGRELLVQ